jgi:peptidoglycan hydrolase-like protein with peptidoglycan-binding domain
VRTISRKAAAWASGAVIVVGGSVAGFYAAGQNHQAQASPGSSGHVSAVHAAAAQRPLRLLSVAPANGSQGVDGTGTVRVTFNEPLPASAPLPRLTPAIAGTWQRAGDSAVFTPKTGFVSGTHVTVTVPKGDSGVRSEYKSTFTTGSYTTLGLQELLAQLGYLPMTWTPAPGAAIPAGSAAAPLATAYDPPPGTFTWQGGYPSQLHSFWKEGSSNLLDKGAITAFEGDHGMTTDGIAGPSVWAALLKAAAAGEHNTYGYSYAVANQASPETLTIWHDGRQVFHSLANTGISIDPTPVGTFPVYEKLPFQVMQGTNPDGSHYADPVQWVSYFSGGSAVHYIARAAYGYPQSLGCVELPYTAARQAYPYLPYGTLVTVTLQATPCRGGAPPRPCQLSASRVASRSVTPGAVGCGANRARTAGSWPATSRVPG